MDNSIIEKIKIYAAKNKKRVFALRNWIALNNKPFNTMDAMLCIYDYCNGSSKVIDSIIDNLTEKHKTYGRTQVYSDNSIKSLDIVKNNGVLQIIGIPTKKEKIISKDNNRNPNIFRKSDNQVKKTYQQMSDRLHNIGQYVREMYPNASKTFIALTIVAIRKYAQEKKINVDKVIKGLINGRLFLDDDDFSIRHTNNEQKIIIIDEDTVKLITEELQMTKYKFVNAIKKFLHDLLVDPSNTRVPSILSTYGYNRHRLMRYLINYNIIEKEEKIVDKNKDGKPMRAIMKVKYKIPKKNFDRKIDRLYIRLFEKNVPSNTVNEDDGSPMGGATGSDSSGQYSQPLFPMQSRKIYNIKETTDTFNVGGLSK